MKLSATTIKNFKMLIMVEISLVLKKLSQVACD
jgi:hypothetical protein